ncbi:hypothetical protein F4X88_19990 [Candidatus Poribacteria bacterium]|nr:hypothetical protein [Candidatus Poribacteria bacterium]MYA58563.1 hypothetical protein [Candidatus Poribacteria bacterium]
MLIQMKVTQLPTPNIELGSPGTFSDPKIGLTEAGPFDLRFGPARKRDIRVGLVGNAELLKNGIEWLERCGTPIPSDIKDSTQYLDFPGFESVFRASLALSGQWMIEIGSDKLGVALSKNNPSRFEAVLDLYADAVEELADNADTHPDIVICCLPKEVVQTCWSISSSLTPRQRRLIKERYIAREQGQQLLFDDIEETESDLLNRDFRRALKARTMEFEIPIQIGTSNLFEDQDTNQDAATRSWNMSVALYYKAGGIPWRFKADGPETCFVGISFHHLRTLQQHFVYSSLAQAFSTRGEGFALRGEAIPWHEKQGRNVHLTKNQAAKLADRVLQEYSEQTGGNPQRIVLHKTSRFNDSEQKGFHHGFRDIPIVELINIMPAQFRLLTYGTYPPRRGTLCTVNETATYLFTTGYMPEWRTYPGPHIPAPVRLMSEDDIDMHQAASDILGLARMNWNTASMSSAHPVTLFFSRRVGGIMAEVGPNCEPNSSFRYYM